MSDDEIKSVSERSEKEMAAQKAEAELSLATRLLAANLLRVIAGTSAEAMSFGFLKPDIGDGLQQNRDYCSPQSTEISGRSNSPTNGL